MFDDFLHQLVIDSPPPPQGRWLNNEEYWKPWERHKYNEAHRQTRRQTKK